MTDKETKKRNSNLFIKIAGYFSRSSSKRADASLKPDAASWQEIKLEISPAIKHYLEMRHVSEDEAKQVIFQAETTKEKLFQPDSGRFLAKLRIGKATFYVEYHPGNECFVIDSAYAHKSEIVG